MENEVGTVLAQSHEIVELFRNLQTVDTDHQVCVLEKPEFPVNGKLRNNEICFYRVEQLVFDEEYPYKEAFENVLPVIATVANWKS